jgi:hypothetical protein
MRSAILLLTLCLTRAVNAQEAEPTPTPSPPTARFEPVPAAEAAPVADDSRFQPPTVPRPEEWRPISNSTDYGGGFERPWPAEPEVERRWYGWQTLVSDAISVVLLAAAVDSGGDEDGVQGGLAGIGILGYAVGAPLVHAGHGHAGKALGSVSLRIVAPIAGAFVGFGMADCDGYDQESYCGLDAAAEGFLLGALAAVVIDAGVIANEDVRPPLRRVETGLRLVPDVRVANDRAQVSLAGRF